MSYTNGLDNPELYFQVKLYTGTGSSLANTGVGFQPDLTWIKGRSGATEHVLTDSVRGVTKELSSNDNGAEETVAQGLTAFGSDGFTVGTDGSYNTSSATYASWNWKAGGSASSNSDGSITTSVSANTTAGFSIVSWSGSGANATIGHGLGAEPKIIFLKIRTGTNNWQVYSKSIGSGNALFLNTTDASGSNIAWQSTDATSSVFYVSGGTAVNGSGQDLIAYCFAEKKGYSKLGSYTGNGNADGTFVYTGFRPAFVMTKSVDSTSSWQIFDNKREGYNVDNDALVAEANTAEVTTDYIDILSNGFKLKIATDPNVAETYIYMAFAEAPFVNSNGVPCTAR